MRNNMQQIKQLVEILDRTEDADDRERIQDEIWTLEEEMEYNEGEEYKERHFNNTHNIFQ